jgi:cardiolipin synthase
MVRCFDADWDHREFTPQPESMLIWCPNDGRQRVARFIDETKETLWVQNERYQDTVIIERLVRAVERGVRVHILARAPHTLKAEKLIEGVGGLRILQDVGAKVHTMKHLKLHAKMLLSDSKRAIVGSINLAPGSFDARRELAIESDNHHVVKRLMKTAEHDWEKSHKLDLSDAGLLKDLKKREGLSPDKLVLNAEHGTKGEHGKKGKVKE